MLKNFPCFGSAEHSSIAPRLYADVITNINDIRQAQRLRYETFAKNTQLSGQWLLETTSRSTWMNSDDRSFTSSFAKQSPTTSVIPALFPERAKQIGDFYSSHEFDLSAIKALPGKISRLGGTCIRKDYRNGATIVVLGASLPNTCFRMATTICLDAHPYRWLMVDPVFSHHEYRSQQTHVGTDVRVTPKLPIPFAAGVTYQHCPNRC